MEAEQVLAKARDRVWQLEVANEVLKDTVMELQCERQIWDDAINAAQTSDASVEGYSHSLEGLNGGHSRERDRSPLPQVVSTLDAASDAGRQTVDSASLPRPERSTDAVRSPAATYGVQSLTNYRGGHVSAPIFTMHRYGNACPHSVQIQRPTIYFQTHRESTMEDRSWLFEIDRNVHRLATSNKDYYVENLSRFTSEDPIFVTAVRTDSRPSANNETDDVQRHDHDVVIAPMERLADGQNPLQTLSASRGVESVSVIPTKREAPGSGGPHRTKK